MVDKNQMDLLNTFISKNKGLAHKAIIMTQEKDYKTCAKIIENFEFNPFDYPIVVNKNYESSINYHINFHDISIYQLIELTFDNNKAINLIIEELGKNKHKNQS